MKDFNPSYYLIFSTSLALIPFFVATCTSYVKVSVVTGMIKNALGVNSLPGFTAEVALSLIITLLSMFPVIEQIKSNFSSITSLSEKPDEFLSLLDKALVPLKNFMLKNSGQKEIEYTQFIIHERKSSTIHKNNDSQKSNTAQVILSSGELSFLNLMPSFLLTELKEALLMSFSILIPFLIIDIIIATLLSSVGMFMVSPTLLSLPLKIFFFVVVDGWMLLVKGLCDSYVIV
jgi:type III secretion protein R